MTLRGTMILDGMLSGTLPPRDFYSGPLKNGQPGMHRDSPFTAYMAK